MNSEKSFHRPAIRKNAWVPDAEVVIIDADLNRSAIGIVAVDEGIEHGLAQGGIGHRVTLDALDALVGDGGFEILGADEVNGLGGLGEKITLNHIVIGKIGLGAKEADFDKGSGDEALGVFVKEQDGGALEVSAIGKLEFFDEVCFR